MTAAAEALNSLFFGFDSFILTALHSLACPFLTFISKLVTVLGEKGLIFIIAAIILMMFKNTRKLGVCLFGAIACGGLITNLILKDAIARPRPFETVELFRQYWIDIGAPAESDFSFPSGHATAAAAGMLAIRLVRGKKWTVPAILWVLLTMFSRNYLMAHYPSDVIAGVIIGCASAVIAFLITKAIFAFLEKHRSHHLAELALEFDLPLTAVRRGGYKGKHER